LASKSNSTVKLFRNHMESFSSLWNFSVDCQFSKQRTWQLRKTLSAFYHNIHAWNNDVKTSIMIFRLYLHFLQFKHTWTTRSSRYFMYKMSDISSHCMYTASNRCHEHEYRFLFHCISIFQILANQIWIITRKYN